MTRTDAAGKRLADLRCTAWHQASWLPDAVCPDCGHRRTECSMTWRPSDETHAERPPDSSGSLRAAEMRRYEAEQADWAKHWKWRNWIANICLAAAVLVIAYGLIMIATGTVH